MGAREKLEFPDFRNLGVMLRILVGVEFARVVASYLWVEKGADTYSWVGESGVLFEVTLLMLVLLLYLLSPYLRTARYRVAVASVLGLSVMVAAGLDLFFQGLGYATSGPAKASIAACLSAAAVLRYFYWRQRALSPALAQSRALALQTRIRPHFLFNSLNTVLAVQRSDPALAERLLLDLTELFRVVLAEPRAMVSLDEELRVARAYIEIEQLRLGSRLAVAWDVRGVPRDACMPVLILQPLLENAVWHGIEPSESGGLVAVRIALQGQCLEIEIRNPYPVGKTSASAGNRIALADIEERLALHFDAEARFRVWMRDGEFGVEVRFPLRRSCSGPAGSENDPHFLHV